MAETIVITGVTSGLGVSWLYQLDDAKNATFYILGRDQKKFQQLIEATPLKNPVHFISCHLDSFDSIKQAVAAIENVTSNVDVLINNAGVWSNDALTLTKDHIEQTVAVNVLAPFLLSGLLLPLLKKSAHARIINTASFRHKDAKIDMEDFELKKHFNAEQAYCNSKLYILLLTKKLAQQLLDDDIKVSCFDPGIVDTPMLYQGFPRSLLCIYPFFRRFIARTPEKGADTGVYLSLAPNSDILAGGYYKDRQLKKVSDKANSHLNIEWLWRESERLTGFSYS